MDRLLSIRGLFFALFLVTVASMVLLTVAAAVAGAGAGG